MPDIHTILKKYWGYSSFRPLQEEIIQSVLQGYDTLALLPTGGGKSLCYQIPAMTQKGLCLVITPLIALMKDQVQNLRRKGITAFAVYSGMFRKEVVNIFKVAAESNCKFLYVSPERLETSLFREYLPAWDVNLIAVDEAHCISQWGYDFRPSYLRIAGIREELPDVPVLALTASATPEVQKDICEKLRIDYKLSHGQSYTMSLQPCRSHLKQEEIKGWRLFRYTFERANLSYSTCKVDSKINKITEILQKIPGSSIVYCKSRKRTKELSQLLKMQQIEADFYHAGLPQDERNEKQEKWMTNKIRVMVCTEAFGMGIDKPDVRTVIHADVPDCLESYYQEAGRAGRDGKTAYAVLLYDDAGMRELEQLPNHRFPSLQDIRSIYQAIANYLQIPTGTGKGEYFDFDLTDFLKKFKVPAHATLYALKALEQEGWLAFNEQVFIPSQIKFTIDKDSLYEYEKLYPSHEACIKTLLRVYEGIFDQPTPVSEKTIAGILKTNFEEVKKMLNQLDQQGVIEYRPQKDSPQILLLHDRIKAEDVNIDMAAYELRKKEFQKRVAKMLEYVKEENQCRSRFIGKYFGDEKLSDCGICDNCLKQKEAVLSKEEFKWLQQRIINLVKYEKMHTRELLLKLNGIKKEKALKVLEFLQAENKIGMDEAGRVSLK